MTALTRLVPRSRLGIALVLVYAALVAWAFYDAAICTGFLCGLIVFLPILPEFLVVARFGALEVPLPLAYVIYAVSVVLNAWILYRIGAAIGTAVRRKRSGSDQ